MSLEPIANNSSEGEYKNLPESVVIPKKNKLAAKGGSFSNLE